MPLIWVDNIVMLMVNGKVYLQINIALMFLRLLKQEILQEPVAVPISTQFVNATPVPDEAR